MVRIRLLRTGRKKLPAYRVVVADQRARRDGKFIEILGSYSPLGSKVFKIDKERYNYWVSKGAQPTETVVKLVGKGASK